MEDSDNNCGNDNVGYDGDQVMGINSGDSAVVSMATSSQSQAVTTAVASTSNNDMV